MSLDNLIGIYILLYYVQILNKPLSHLLQEFFKISPKLLKKSDQRNQKVLEFFRNSSKIPLPSDPRTKFRPKRIMNIKECHLFNVVSFVIFRLIQ